MQRMCGRYELHTPVEEVARRFDAVLTDAARALPPRYNIAPTLQVPVLRQGRRGREIEAMTWGLTPSWAKDRSGVKPINARAETVFERPMFRNAIARRRCLLPADGFYEWQRGPARKQPYHVGMADGGLLALAGVWEYWAQEGQEPLVSCCIVVTDANALMAAIHERMPVIIAPQDYARWLDPALSGRATIEPMLAPLPAAEMRAYPISTRVNDVKNDAPELIEPA
ncbi:MAG TPA: SOS response-associated peptidase [Burkholderiales bacterium]|nr:SOS response-associated peptidase [Burkholderiales bacterium]